MSSFKILSIFYSEFNLDRGAEIVYQLPPNTITPQDFIKISEFMIPKIELCDKRLALHLGDAYLLGYPIFLTNSFYERNRFQFNFCIMVEKNEYENNFYLYDNLVQKINTTFERIEIDHSFDFMKKNREVIQNFLDELHFAIHENKNFINIHFEEDLKDDDESKLFSSKTLHLPIRNLQENLKANYNLSGDLTQKMRITPVNSHYVGSINQNDKNNKVKDIVDSQNTLDIESSGSAKDLKDLRLNINKSSSNITSHKKIIGKIIINFNFRYINFNNEKIKIEDYFVPIWIKELNKDEINMLDELVLMIIKKINGVNPVKMIQKSLSIEAKTVKYILNSLYCIGAISFVDIFQFSNIYKPTSELKKFQIKGILKKFKNFQKLNENNGEEEEETENSLGYKSSDKKDEFMDDQKFFSYYILLTNSKNVEDFVDKLNEFQFNLPIFIAFGVYLKIIVRKHLYFKLSQEIKISKLSDAYEVIKMMDGKHPEDQICLENKLSLTKIKDYYDKYKKDATENTCYFIYK